MTASRQAFRLSAVITSIGILLDRKSTRLNSSHTEIYTLSLHDALPISGAFAGLEERESRIPHDSVTPGFQIIRSYHFYRHPLRSEEHTSELQSHRDLHSFPTRRSSDLGRFRRVRGKRK